MLHDIVAVDRGYLIDKTMEHAEQLTAVQQILDAERERAEQAEAALAATRHVLDTAQDAYQRNLATVGELYATQTNSDRLTLAVVWLIIGYAIGLAA